MDKVYVLTVETQIDDPENKLVTTHGVYAVRGHAIAEAWNLAEETGRSNEFEEC